ncbi:hypothetical protein SCHPADRAFT_341157 [Schizopora paradoxa]|uniref:Uncharacterized protein n=1 Tax=Schizopora paradoxa TaxID=27342 RepID=A0A0H2RPI0_9AGAM|nr:hypothetical protein SCHPADRAFT_341157 [Schizopora paradoxa]
MLRSMGSIKPYTYAPFGGIFGNGMVAGTSYSMYSFTWAATVSSLPGLSRGCLMQYGNNDLWMALPILIFCECLALGLLLVKAAKHSRATKILRTQGPSDNILVTMAHDGIGYFACSIAISIASFLVIKYITYDDFLFILQGAVQAILCSRLLFHVYAVNHRKRESDSDAIQLHQAFEFVRRTYPKSISASEMP